MAVTLSYRPDAAKGEVTGSVTGVGMRLEPGASAVTVLIDVDPGVSLGVDLILSGQGCFAARSPSRSS